MWQPAVDLLDHYGNAFIFGRVLDQSHYGLDVRSESNNVGRDSRIFGADCLCRKRWQKPTETQYTAGDCCGLKHLSSI
jgi:hypothetical protein